MTDDNNSKPRTKPVVKANGLKPRPRRRRKRVQQPPSRLYRFSLVCMLLALVPAFYLRGISNKSWERQTFIILMLCVAVGFALSYFIEATIILVKKVKGYRPRKKKP